MPTATKARDSPTALNASPRRPGAPTRKNPCALPNASRRKWAAPGTPARRKRYSFAYYNGKSKRIVDSTDTKIREQKSFGIVERPYCPAVLVEQCFLTITAMWKTGRRDGCARAARIYYEAICAYFGTEPLPQGGSV